MKKIVFILSITIASFIISCIRTSGKTNELEQQIDISNRNDEIEQQADVSNRIHEAIINTDCDYSYTPEFKQQAQRPDKVF